MLEHSPDHETFRSSLLEKTKQDYEDLISEAAKGAIFRSKCRWYNEAEKSTKYFFNLEKNRVGSKCMSLLKNEDGSEVTNPELILEKQREFYARLYTADPFVDFTLTNSEDIQLDENEKCGISGDLSMEELTTALKQSKKECSPGCDGLMGAFYVIFWTLIKEPLHSALTYLLQQGKLFTSALQGIITMIPKKGKDCRFIKNLRPITLLNTDYKLLEKVIANHIKPLLQNLIHQDQKGFLSNRRISSNIRCILDIMDQIEKHEDESLIISINYEKCFDRVERCALLGALRYFNFPENIVSWTNTLYTNAQSCVTNFGYCSKYFNVTRSIKQGGPCSSYYFLIVAELLAIALRKNQNIEGINIAEFKKLFGQYADDMDIYCKNTRENLNQIDFTLSEFCKQTGFKINYDKTTIYRISNDSNSVASIYTIKGMRVELEKIAL